MELWQDPLRPAVLTCSARTLLVAGSARHSDMLRRSLPGKDFRHQHQVADQVRRAAERPNRPVLARAMQLPRVCSLRLLSRKLPTDVQKRVKLMVKSKRLQRPFLELEPFSQNRGRETSRRDERQGNGRRDRRGAPGPTFSCGSACRSRGSQLNRDFNWTILARFLYFSRSWRTCGDLHERLWATWLRDPHQRAVMLFGAGRGRKVAVAERPTIWLQAAIIWLAFGCEKQRTRVREL